MKIKRLIEEFSVCKVKDITGVKFNDEFCFFGKTDEELSLVCLTNNVPENTTHRDDGWKAFRIQGELDFSLIGILSKISGVLADNQIGIFAISTYNTDYIFTKAENYERALKVLQEERYEIVTETVNDELSTIKIGQPAYRALTNAGIRSLKQLTHYREEDLLSLHGFGHKALGILKAILEKDGLSLKKEESDHE